VLYTKDKVTETSVTLYLNSADIVLAHAETYSDSPTMAVYQERLVPVTAHHTSPAYKIVYVPAHFSIDQTRVAIHSAIGKHLGTQGALTITPDLSSIIIASGKFLQHRLCSLTIEIIRRFWAI
jgi:hypothetical protein